MDLMKLQNLLNECIMIEQGNYLGGNFSVDLAEAQAELDQAKQLLLHGVVRRSEQLVCRYCKTELNNPISKRAGYCDSWCVERDKAN